ncbi:hypothetical protein BGZ63DRAFT_361745 [Mariannaea sp. PMI_226]|nr:hypothetical protein BGZ63DRAFT_361745 [Mariannaea sp. PMI_226]
MDCHPLRQIHLGNQQAVTQEKAGRKSHTQDEDGYQVALLSLCPVNSWPSGSHTSASSRPILIGKHHQERLQALHTALVSAITDIVQRWWTDLDAQFPERMPLEKEEEALLKWMEGEVARQNLPKFSSRLGSWRPDFMVEVGDSGEEVFSITEINARFCFNGFMHVFYGQHALEGSLHGLSDEESKELIGANDPETMLSGLFSLFDMKLPLHLLKGKERGFDIHMVVDMLWRRFGIKPRIISPTDLRLVPDGENSKAYKLCCLAKNGHDMPAESGLPTFVTEAGEIVEEIHQVGLELHQHELISLEPELLRQVSLRCFNGMRTILLVHDKRMLGIVKQEIPGLVARNVLTLGQARDLADGVVDTILPGSRELQELLCIYKDSPQVKDQYILKPIRSGKGDGIIFGDDSSANEWAAVLERLRHPRIIPGVTCVLQRRILPRLYDIVLKLSEDVAKYPLIETYHVINGNLVGLGIWRAGKGRVIALSSGGSWMCSVIAQS